MLLRWNRRRARSRRASRNPIQPVVGRRCSPGWPRGATAKGNSPLLLYGGAWVADAPPAGSHHDQSYSGASSAMGRPTTSALQTLLTDPLPIIIKHRVEARGGCMRCIANRQPIGNPALTKRSNRQKGAELERNWNILRAHAHLRT
jgi:hypothetical protein